MAYEPYVAVLAALPFEMLPNYDFSSGLDNWTDDTGSWTLAGGGGVEYDNDGESNPLTTNLELLTSEWVHFGLNKSVGATGSLVFEIRNSLGIPVYNSNTESNYIHLVPDTYTFAIIADDFVGQFISLSMRIAVYRPPTPDESDVELGTTEYLDNPIFATDLSGWTDATSSWSWDNHDGAVYDNDGAGNRLTQDVSLGVGWYRLGVQLADGSTMTSLIVDVNGIAESQILYHTGARESYFYINTADTYTVRIQAEDLAGYVSLVTLTDAVERKSNHTISKLVRGVVTTVYDLRNAYDSVEQINSIMMGRNSGKLAFYASGSVAIGEDSLYGGGDNSVAIGNSARMNRGFGNTAVGSQAQRDAVGDLNVAVGKDAGQNNVGDENVFLGAGAGKDASTSRSVLVGYHAGQTETADDKLHIANNQDESLVKGDFAERTLAFGFPDLSDGSATVDIAASTVRPSLRSRGGVRMARKTVTGAYTATLADYTICGNASGGAFSVVLPAASGNDGLVYVVKKVDPSVNAVTVDANGSETIDGSTTKVLAAQYDQVTIMCDGSGWLVI